MVDVVDFVVDLVADTDAQGWSPSPLSGLLHPAAALVYLDPASVRCERQRERLRLLNMPWLPMVMVVDDSVAGVVALVNLATTGATAETSVAAECSSLAPPSAAPAFMEDIGIAGNASAEDEDAAIDPAANVVLPSIDDNLHEMD